MPNITGRAQGPAPIFFLMKSYSKNVLPGFKLRMGYTVFYLLLIVVFPLSTLFIKTFGLTWDQFVAVVTSPRVVASYKLSVGAAFLAASINVVFGLLVAWVLVRYKFPGKKIVDSLVDFPFALPTAVAGIALTTLYASNGFFGSFFEKLGIKTAFSPIGIIIALIFIGLPFVVRTVQPVLEDLEPEIEEAAACLGAKRLQTFIYLILPELAPALLTGFVMAFARGLGEYGSVVFISGNIPFQTEITPLLIMTKLEQFDYKGATAIATVTLVFSFLLLIVINFLNARLSRKFIYKA